jgi:hypothetical protein
VSDGGSGAFVTSCSAIFVPILHVNRWYNSRMANLTSVLHQLEQERSRLAAQLENLKSAISVLSGTGNNRTGRTISAAGRARIAAAQRARWAKAKGGKVVSIARGGRRKMSAAAIARIRAAQKARWAKWRKAQKG